MIGISKFERKSVYDYQELACIPVRRTGLWYIFSGDFLGKMQEGGGGCRWPSCYGILQDSNIYNVCPKTK